ncbi:MAG: DUF6588 family protein [Patiriisocius sp.]|uniref:DUF6588 family protein n=1 Tax=Patiriisocius sp. TaxID=2822396 RepID=UPI003EF4798F
MQKSILFTLFLIGTISANAQTFIADVEDFLVDMVFISNQYVSPAADAAVFQSSSSWHTTATGLYLFEVDGSIHFNILPVPKSQQSFTVSNSDFISLNIRGANTAQVPTALGGDTNVFYDFVLDGDDYELQTFEGAKQSTFYYPYLQASVGLWRETELTIQYAPEIKIDESGYQTFGAAIKHNVSQYWQQPDDTNGVEVAVQVAYSLFDSQIYFDDFAIKQSNPEPGDIPLAIINSLTVDANSWTGQIIGSKRFNDFEVVGSFAVLSNKFDYTMGGEGDLFLNLLNEAFTALEDANTLVKGNLGMNYHFNKFYVAGTVSLGKFLNTNVSLHYRI